MADDFNFEKTYAEMILKASNVAERRCLCFDHDVISLKNDSFRLFLRFHDHFHLKITEAETRSLNQQMKIEELEAQLSEAEDIIVDLREQLKQVQDQLEIARDKHNSNISDELINESVPLDNEKSYNISDKKSISLDLNSDAMVVNECCQPVASTTWTTESDSNYYHVSKDGITSFVQPNKEIYLYKNGCTERVCATESNPFIELSPLETGHTLDKFQSDNSQCPVIENKLRKADSDDNSGDKPSVGSYEPGKNEKTSQNGVGKQVVHESGSYKAQESRSCRRSPGKNARYREAISVLKRSCRKKPLRSWQKPLPQQQKVLSSGVNEESVDVPVKVIDKMPKIEVGGAAKSNDMRSNCQLSDGVFVDSSLVDVPIVDESYSQHCSDHKGKVLKFTFYRKRRKNVMTNVDGNIVSDRSAAKRKL